VDSRAGLDGAEKIKILRCLELNLCRPARSPSPYRLNYPDSTSMYMRRFEVVWPDFKEVVEDIILSETVNKLLSDSAPFRSYGVSNIWPCCLDVRVVEPSLLPKTEVITKLYKIADERVFVPCIVGR
jgi:hypothetical protein